MIGLFIFLRTMEIAQRLILTALLFYYKDGVLDMKLEEALEKIIALEKQIKEQNEAFKALETSKQEMLESLTNKDEEIKSLKESNMRFFEQLTIQNQQEQDDIAEIEQETDAMDWDDFLAGGI